MLVYMQAPSIHAAMDQRISAHTFISALHMTAATPPHCILVQAAGQPLVTPFNYVLRILSAMNPF